jgi:hypothetical protein
MSCCSSFDDDLDRHLKIQSVLLCSSTFHFSFCSVSLGATNSKRKHSQEQSGDLECFVGGTGSVHRE